MTTTIEVTDPVTGKPFGWIEIERDDATPMLRLDLEYTVLLDANDVRRLVAALLDGAALLDAGR